MIVFEDGIDALVNQIPAIVEGANSFAPNFHWGNQSELNRYILLKSQPYPIIWLVTGGETHSTKDGEITRDCRFIIAVRDTNVNELNDYRLRNSYLNFLNPLADRLLEGLRKFRITDLPEQEYKLEKLPNYSDFDDNTKTSAKNKTIDLWDALTIDCKITMNSNCQNVIKWQ